MSGNLVHRFFDLPSTRWRQLSGCLHLYAWPESHAPVRADFARMSASLERISALGLQPEQFMHVTMQRFDAYDSDLSSPAWRALVDALPGVMAAHRPFTLEFAHPRAMSHAVEAIGAVTPEWTSLMADIHAAVEECGLASVLTEPPRAPHFTIAYGLADTDAALVDAALAAAAVPTSFGLDRVALVSVDQDRRAGTFSFRPLASWALGKRRVPAGDPGR